MEKIKNLNESQEGLEKAERVSKLSNTFIEWASTTSEEIREKFLDTIEFPLSGKIPNEEIEEINAEINNNNLRRIIERENDSEMTFQMLKNISKIQKLKKTIKVDLQYPEDEKELQIIIAIINEHDHILQNNQIIKAITEIAHGRTTQEASESLLPAEKELINAIAPENNAQRQEVLSRYADQLFSIWENPTEDQKTKSDTLKGMTNSEERKWTSRNKAEIKKLLDEKNLNIELANLGKEKVEALIEYCNNTQETLKRLNQDGSKKLIEIIKTLRNHDQMQIARSPKLLLKIRMLIKQTRGKLSKLLN